MLGERESPLTFPPIARSSTLPAAGAWPHSTQPPSSWARCAGPAPPRPPSAPHRPPRRPQVNTKYYVVAQFSRHIRPGMTILGGAADPRNATALALSADGATLVVVTSNPTGAPADVVVDVSAFGRSQAGAPVAQWLTSMASGTPTPGAAYTRVSGAVVAKDLTVALSLPAFGLVTLEVPVQR